MLELLAEHKAIVDSVGQVTISWANLESDLFELFQLLCGQQESRYIPGVIFYTPSNVETRISLVDNLITYHCEFNSIGEADERLLALWNPIKGKINKLKNTRNAVVHGKIIGEATADSFVQSRLGPPFSDTMRLLPKLITGQMGGLGSNELMLHHQAVTRVSERMRKLNEAFQLRMQVISAPDRDATIRKLLELTPQVEIRSYTQNSQDQEPLDKTGRDPSSLE